MSKFELYHLVLLLTGQLVIVLLAVWGMISKKFKGQKDDFAKQFGEMKGDFAKQIATMEKTFDTKMTSIKELYESDVRSLRVQISDMKCEIKTRVEVFREEAKSYVTVRVCEARTKYEDKTLGMLETRLAEISEKLDQLMLQKSATLGG